MEFNLQLILLLSSCLLAQAALFIAYFFKKTQFYIFSILAILCYSIYAYADLAQLRYVLISLHIIAYSWLIYCLRTKRRDTAPNDHLYNLGLLSSEICHELASPLMVIEASLMTLKNKIQKGDEKHQKSFERLDRQVKKLYHILLRFRSLTISTGATAEWHFVHIENTINDSLLKLQTISQSIELHKTIELSAEEIHIPLEQAELQQVFSALLLNAHEACDEEKTRIQMKIIENQTHLIFTIEDNGRGFERKNWEQAFKPFYSSKEKGRGLGLGLPVVLKMLEKGQGTIELRSEYPTLIEIKLPKISASEIDAQSSLLSPSQTL